MPSDQPTPARCSALYPSKSRDPNTRIVHCELPDLHPGDHEEVSTESTWPREPTKAAIFYLGAGQPIPGAHAACIIPGYGQLGDRWLCPDCGRTWEAIERPTGGPAWVDVAHLEAARQAQADVDAAYERGKAEGRRLAARTLRTAAAGRRTYAETASITASLLEAEAGLLDRAADAAEGDLKPMYGWLPSWQWTDEMNAQLNAAGGSDA